MRFLLRHYGQCAAACDVAAFVSYEVFRLQYVAAVFVGGCENVHDESADEIIGPGYGSGETFNFAVDGLYDADAVRDAEFTRALGSAGDGAARGS